MQRAVARLLNAAGIAAPLLWAVTLIAALTLPLWLIRFGTDLANVGLFQRASFGVLNLWVLVFAVVVWSPVTPNRWPVQKDRPYP
jgi:hypothetical protein